MISDVKSIDLHVTLINPCVQKTQSLGRLSRRWEDNIKIDLQEVGLGGTAWTGSIWLRIGTGGGNL